MLDADFQVMIATDSVPLSMQMKAVIGEVVLMNGQSGRALIL